MTAFGRVDDLEKIMGSSVIAIRARAARAAASGPPRQAHRDAEAALRNALHMILETWPPGTGAPPAALTLITDWREQPETPDAQDPSSR